MMEPEYKGVVVPMSNGLERHNSAVSSHSSKSGVVYRKKKKSFSLWRVSSYGDLAKRTKRNKSSSIASSEHSDWNDSVFIHGEDTTADNVKKLRNKRRWSTLVTIVVVQAKGLPHTSEDCSAYCKVRLGSESYKTKSVKRSQQPEWREQFQLHIYKDNFLRLSLWEKGKDKNFMGSCVVDLMGLEKERTHEIWQELDDGFGVVHLYVTLCTIRDIPSTNDEPPQSECWTNKCAKSLMVGYNWQELLRSDYKLVGELHVRVIAARGLPSKPNAYCTLEVHNQRVQTHADRATSEPTWNKNYVFDVYDVTSTLDVEIFDDSITLTKNEALGGLSIPLLRIDNGEMRWYALKDKTKRNAAKGNHPRLLLQMYLVWNPTKAALKLIRPKEVKYLEKPKKWDTDLIYKNVVFVQDVFKFLHNANSFYMQLFEWENQDLSLMMLMAWLVFWFYFRPWAIPLFSLVPFIHSWVSSRSCTEKILEKSIDEEMINESEKHGVNFAGKLKALPDMTVGIVADIELIVSFAERVYNVATFKVPFLSYITMIALVAASFVLYFVPFNYLMMGLGIYKFTRKYLNPDRKLNNDLIDFISRIPDNEVLKDWKELSVPEPILRSSTHTYNRSFSNISSTSNVS